MKYSYNWLKEYVPKLPEPKKLVELLTMRAFEVEGVEVVGKDTVLEIKVLFNRAFDCLSHIGMAREIAAIGDYRLRTTDYRPREDKSLKIKDFLSIDVQDKKLCPRYSARVVVDVKISESPRWMQDRLVACGLRPINNIVDITNYVMLEIGQPMHAFDLDKCDANNTNRHANDANKKTIVVRRAERGEKITILDGGEYNLNENVLVIADEAEPLAIAGIKGGKKAEIGIDTKAIILEAANFELTATRKNSKALNLRTDASVRFENGLDVNSTLRALDRAAELIQKIVGGKIVSGIADSQAARPRRASTAVAHSYIESLLGVNIKSGEVVNIFKRLLLPTKVIKKKNDIFYEVLIPSWRNDLATGEDLIEEVGRLCGYEKIPAIMPTSVLIAADKNEELINEDAVKDIMVGAGYTEVYNYSLISESDKEVFGLKEMVGPRHPLSREQKYLRPNLIVGLVKNVESNLRYFDEIRLFEIGRVFRLEGKKIREKKMISGVLGAKMERVRKRVEKSLFSEGKGIIDLLLEKMGVADVWYDDFLAETNEMRMFQPAKRALVKTENKTLGWLGEINKTSLSVLGIGESVFAFELDFELLNELVEREVAYRAPSKYPAIVRDLSLLVQPQTKIDQVLDIIENIGGALIIDTELFDVYEKGGQKGLAFRIIYQSNERTLTDVEVNASQQKIIKAMEERGWEARR
ncbi:MAG: phenylalanine--tRNA ligase subunit beta [Candidatus Portnoybacteria bacterium CG_4_10_14_0_2_um_filter_44_20]|uniref:Phenylalanine--tRNA ligase beta subunit n=3 Tax=Candidatus Portnoyibacteriota TaxID=1817913 RepID=A0A2M7UCM4_9BACT|nr:MAG: phenylalanine--tRNA ligase subunit beta [Candidatus Portnoybacteria bacterium CG_4_10_14_0_2_um_filter_44_20]